MTTGEPLVAQVAMKPMPTLTKPLRSVDIATHEPAQALRERTDSCVVPAAGVVGEAMVAFVLADAYRAQVRRRPHRRRARRRATAYERTDRVARLTVVVGFMGAGRRPLARELADARGCARRHRRAARGALRQADRRGLRREGEAAFRAAEEEVVLGVLDGAQARTRRLARRRRGRSAAGARRAGRPHRRCCSTSPLDVAWARAAGRRPPAGRATATRSRALHGERQALYESLADAHLPQGDTG